MNKYSAVVGGFNNAFAGDQCCIAPLNHLPVYSQSASTDNKGKLKVDVAILALEWSGYLSNPRDLVAAENPRSAPASTDFCGTPPVRFSRSGRA